VKPRSPYPGRLVAFEGLDGSGKSTQMHLLERWLAGQHCRVFFSEWASSDLVKGVTRRGRRQQLFTPTTFSLVHATDFADRYERQILPMLKGGFLVLCDRYTFTSFARDRVRGCDPAWLRELYGFAHVPDLTFFMDLPLHVALDRTIRQHPELSYFEAGMDLGLSQDQHESFRIYQGRVLEQYLEMANEFGFTLHDATREVHAQQERIRAVIADHIDLASFRDGGSR
jgi:dTMP kinase